MALSAFKAFLLLSLTSCLLVASPARATDCTGKVKGKFYCVDTTKFAWCYGLKNPAMINCPGGTQCLCGSTNSAPCGWAGTTPLGCSGTPGSEWSDVDACPNDPSKNSPGVCGCGIPDTDTDKDGTPDCKDACPRDPAKTAAGNCGCGVPEVAGCGADQCPNDPSKTAPGVCGCGVPDTDTDKDGTPDCRDGCPSDPSKTNPGTCGCGKSEPTTAGGSCDGGSGQCKKLFGGWAMIAQGSGSTDGTPEQWMQEYTNLMIFAFVDPSTMVVPPVMVRTVGNFKRAGQKILFSLGGGTWGDRWTWTRSREEAIQAARTVSTWVTTYGISGVDIDAEEGSVVDSDPANTAAFMAELKRLHPGITICLSVYGWPDQRTYHNYLINNYLTGTGEKLLDFIVVMAYDSFEVARSYVERYTKPPVTTWLPRPVPKDKVMIGIAAHAYFGQSCNPPAYGQFVNYVNQEGLLGLSVWAFNWQGVQGTSWYTSGCQDAYISMYRGLGCNKLV